MTVVWEYCRIHRGPRAARIYFSQAIIMQQPHTTANSLWLCVVYISTDTLPTTCKQSMQKEGNDGAGLGSQRRLGFFLSGPIVNKLLAVRLFNAILDVL